MYGKRHNDLYSNIGSRKRQKTLTDHYGAFNHDPRLNHDNFTRSEVHATVDAREDGPKQDADSAKTLDNEPNSGNSLLPTGQAEVAASIGEVSSPRGWVLHNNGANPDSRASESDEGVHVIIGSKDWLKLRGIPVLELIAYQLLEIFAKSSADELLQSIQHSNPSADRTWVGLHILFENSRALYELGIGSASPFVMIEDIKGLKQDTDVRLRRINLATAIWTLLHDPYTSLQAIHDHFSGLFVPAGQKLQYWQVMLYASVKKQCRDEGYGRSDQPDDERFRYLWQNELDEQDNMIDSTSADLRDAFDCLKNVQDYCRSPGAELKDNARLSVNSLSGIVQHVLPELKHYVLRVIGLQASGDGPEEVTSVSDTHDISADLAVTPDMLEEELAAVDDDANVFAGSYDQDEMIRQAAHAALMGQSEPDESLEEASEYRPQSQEPAPRSLSIQPRQSSHHIASERLQKQASSPTPSSGVTSIKEQYQQARLAAAEKAAAKAKAAAASTSQRRPWTQEEENALMTGLDRVQGPHWSQILAMYGAEGTISEILKDRSQVQLKDKARNLKLYFLKNGHEVPHYLNHVTGDLRSRAPTTAAKKEAKRKLKESAGEDKAVADAIRLLASGRIDIPLSSYRRMGAELNTDPREYEEYPGNDTNGAEDDLINVDEVEANEGREPDEMMVNALHKALAAPGSISPNVDPG